MLQCYQLQKGHIYKIFDEKDLDMYDEKEYVFMFLYFVKVESDHVCVLNGFGIERIHFLRSTKFIELA
jgi:hypothetical protein